MERKAMDTAGLIGVCGPFGHIPVVAWSRSGDGNWSSLSSKAALVVLEEDVVATSGATVTRI